MSIFYKPISLRITSNIIQNLCSGGGGGGSLTVKGFVVCSVLLAGGSLLIVVTCDGLMLGLIAVD